VDSWDDAAQARFDERTPRMCSNCKKTEAGADGLCPRCSENLDAIENNSDVESLVRLVRAYFSRRHADHEIDVLLSYFPPSERELPEERRREAQILMFPGA
jgi:hypothetical protein